VVIQSGNIFVVDLDDISLYDDYPAELKETLVVKTGKGYHLYYHFHGMPPPNKKLDDKRGRHIDIKSQGGYVLAPSSIHPNGSVYTVITDKEPMEISGTKLRESLEAMGFDVATKSIAEIEDGISEGGRNDMTFNYACSMIRDRGLYGMALRLQVEELNSRHTPPLPLSELDIIISQAEKTEKANMVKHIQKARTVVEQLKGAPVVLKMQNITPSFENKPIQFDCMIIAVGERMTYTVSGTHTCRLCSKSRKIFCDDMHKLAEPVCMCSGHPQKMTMDETTKVTAYIQQMRIQEFLEDARNSSPIQFDAEIIDEDVGEAFIGDRKTVIAKVRSIQRDKKKP